MLKLRFVLAMKVDYFDNRIQLGARNRVFRGEFDSLVGLLSLATISVGELFHYFAIILGGGGRRRIRIRSLWDK